MSDITLDEYYESIKEKISFSSDLEASPKEDQFLNWALEYLQDLGDIDQFQLVDDARDSSDRYRADAFTEENQDGLEINSLGIVISLFDQASNPETLTRTDLQRFLKKQQTFVLNALNKDIDEIYEVDGGANILSKKIRSLHKLNNPKIRFYIVSNKPLSSRITDLEVDEIDGFKVDVHIWDLNRFYQNEMQGKERIDTDIALDESPIPVLNASYNENDLQIFLAVIPAKTLYNIFDKWGSRLLEQNVRSFLGATNAANKGMRETIRTAPEKFIAFNNGISATAEDIKLNQKNEITFLKNFQIVNGGQTTATIYSAGKKQLDLDNIFVQMKLVVVKDVSDSEIFIKISEYSNTQSKVQKSDFFSHHDFHKRIHEFSKRIIAPPKPNTVNQTKWYYERLKKQYLNEQTHLTSAEKNKFLREYPKNQLINKTDLGKYYMTFESNPTSVAKGGEYNFSRFRNLIIDIWDQNEQDINEEFFKDIVSKSIIWTQMYKYFLSEKMTSPSKIGTYAISLLMNKIKNENKNMNFIDVWRTQSVPDNLFELLVSIGNQIYRIAVDDNRPVDNIDSYLKTEQFWTTVKNNITNINLNSIENLFIGKSEVNIQKKENRKNQKLTNILEIEIMIKSTKPDEWKKIEEYLRANNEETPSKISLIHSAIKSVEKLSPAQCEMIYKSFYADYLEHKS